MLLSTASSAQLLAAGSLMPQAARPCSHESSDIFVRIQSTPSTRSGRGSAVLENGTATNGANGFQIMRTIAARHENGPRIIFSGVAGGSGSFRCRAAMSALASFTTVAFSNFQRERLWDNDC